MKWFVVLTIFLLSVNVVGQTFLDEIGNTIDSDSTTSTPNFREFKFDRGFVGEVAFDIRVNLKPNELYRIRYAKKKEIIIVNTDKQSKKGVSTMSYTFSCAARKLRKRPLRIEILNFDSIEELKKKYKVVESLDTPTFKGYLMKK